MQFRDRVIGALLAAGLAAAPAAAAQLEGIRLPDVRDVAGTRLVLNGIALRTYSILRIRIYVAGLYLEHRSSNAEAILDAPDTKLLEFHFLRDIQPEAEQKAWRRGFAQNCTAPCRLDPQEVARFLAALPTVRAGDVSDFLFTRQGLVVTFNGQPRGTITDQIFAHAVLASFLGPAPPTPRVKRELLGG